MGTSPASPPAIVVTRPLFGGYVLVAACAAWLGGVAVQRAGPLAAWSPWIWLIGAGSSALVWAVLQLGWRERVSSRAQRALGLATAAVLLGFWLALGAGRSAWSEVASGPRSVAMLPQHVTLELRGDVSAEPLPERKGRLLVIAVAAVSRDNGRSWLPASGRVEAFLDGPDDWFAPVYGDTLVLTGKLQAFQHGAPAGVSAQLGGARARVVARGGGSPLLASLYALRVRLATNIQHALPEPEAALLIGILLGLKTPMLRARLPLFTVTGTIHLVVPAGLKVSVLADLARRGTGWLGRWPGTAASLLTVFGYAALGGGGPAAVRAAIMGALLVVGSALRRQYDVFTGLACAVLLMTAFDPLLIYDAGFQLTTLATLGIPLLAPLFERWLVQLMHTLRLPDGLAPACELLAVAAAAQVATLPIVAINFGLISFVAPLANLLVVPLLAPSLVLGVALSVTVALAPLLTLVATCATWPVLWLMDRAIELCAGLPGASAKITSVPAWAPFLYYVAIGAGWLACTRLGQPAADRDPHASGWLSPGRSRGSPASGRVWRVALAGTCLLVLAGAWGAVAPSLAAPSARLEFFDVGPGGQATLVRLADGTTVMIDGGPDGPSLETALAARLPVWQRSLDLVVLSDAQPGDATGLQDLTGHFTIAHAADAEVLHPTQVYVAWLDALARGGVPHALVRRDDVIHLGTANSLTVLSPPGLLYPARGGATTESNDLVLRLDTPGLRVLLLGAADAYALDALAFSGERLDADVVQIALPPLTAIDLVGPLGAVLEAAHPRLIVVTQAPSTAGTPRAGGPRPSALSPSDSFVGQALGAVIARTSDVGSVSLVQRSDGGWSVQH